MFRNVCVLVFIAVFQPMFFEETTAEYALATNDMFVNPNERCLTEAGIKREDLLRYMENHSYSDILEENRSCYVLCVGKEQGKVNANGTFNIVAFTKDGTNESHMAELLPFFTKCVEEQGANPCETLKKNFECMWTAVRKYGKIPVRKLQNDIKSLVPNNVTNA